MRPNDYPGTVNGRFVDSPTPDSLSGTILTADFFNSISNEIINAIQAGSISLDRAREDQLAQAIRSIAGSVTAAAAEAVDSALTFPAFPSAEGPFQLSRTRYTLAGSKTAQENIVMSSRAQEAGPIRMFFASSSELKGIVKISGLVPKGQFTASVFVGLSWEEAGKPVAFMTFPYSGNINDAGEATLSMSSDLQQWVQPYATVQRDVEAYYTFRLSSLLCTGYRTLT
ncbi:MAG TPA: hypothetical protein VE954_06685 [Oligoflexus sp.]|uniref:hypothetical protein n=1 Tax=Oligoflexus sp. TaxID=1971216 RepID=UPI002D6A756C|nr:hypothetical protein [Oligoflexus sp.]HYX32783.1 hypothetical protein [Oligoflexus sp.]